VSFLVELRRRNVIRMAGLYLVAAWLVTQVAGTLLPMFDAPAWIARAVVIALAIGFLPALVFAWVFELTPEGLKRDADVPAAESIAPRTARRMDRAIIVVLLLALGYFAFDKFVLAPRRDAVLVAQAGQAQAKAAAPVVDSRSIAVLPLANDSGDASQQYFSDGLSQDLITALTQFEGLKVISRDSAFQFRGSKDSPAVIAAKLGVAHLLEGAVQHQGDEVRISVTLVNASDGSTLWSQHYDKPYKDLFALQDAITQAVATALKARLLVASGAVVQSERPPSGNLDAYTAYQHGIAFDAIATETSEYRAIDAFGEAVRIDPEYAAAHGRLAFAWTSLASSFLVDAAKIAQAKVEAHKSADAALKLSPDSALAHMARGFVLQNADLDWAGAETEYQRALQLAPNDANALFRLGNILAIRGQLKRATELTRQALATDPRNASWYKWLSAYLAALGRMDDAGKAIGTAIALRPDGTFNYEHLATIEILRNDAKAALAAALQEPSSGWRYAALALAMQISPDREAADAALGKLIAGHAGDSAYQIAEAYALRRDPEAMFQWLDRARANRDPGVGFLLFDPFILRYRDDPRFAAFCRKVGLPGTTDAKMMP